MAFFGWAAAVSTTACTVFIFWMLHRAFQYMYVTVSPVPINNYELVVRDFIALLEEARTSMILYDDGNDMVGSLYNDSRVIDAVRSKLRANPDFELRCLFNCNDDVEFRKQFADEPQVDIRTRSVMDSQRQSKIVDCSNVSKRHRSRVAEIVLGRYKMDFALAFEAARR